MPDSHISGGPFTGSKLARQRLVSNDSFYLTLRDDEGEELSVDDEAKIEIVFKINATDFVFNAFNERM